MLRPKSQPNLSMTRQARQAAKAYHTRCRLKRLRAERAALKHAQILREETNPKKKMVLKSQAPKIEILGRSRPALADLVSRNMRIPVRFPNRFYEADNTPRVFPLSRIPKEDYQSYYMKIGIYSSNELTWVRCSTRMSAYNKAYKFFGKNVAKTKVWRCLLHTIITTGMTRRDFKSLVRLRDLYIRGLYREFRRRCANFIFSLPKFSRVETFSDDGSECSSDSECSRESRQEQVKYRF